MNVTQQFQTGKACCGAGGGSTTLILDKPISRELLAVLVQDGTFMAVDYQTKAGILYVESKALVAQGAFGRNRLQVRCKLGSAKAEECKQHIAAFMAILKAA